MKSILKNYLVILFMHTTVMCSNAQDVRTTIGIFTN